MSIFSSRIFSPRKQTKRLLISVSADLIIALQSLKRIVNIFADIRTTTRILTTLLYTTPKRGLLYVTDTFHSKTTPSPSRKFEHLSCFLPGLLALGVHTLPPEAFQLPPSVLSDMDISDELSHYDLRELHILAAEGLAESCWLMYADQPSGLGPEEALMRQGITWMKELRKWREGGAHGAMPGMGPKKASVDTRYRDKRLFGEETGAYVEAGGTFVI